LNVVEKDSTTVAVVIVTYNSGEDIMSCLEGVLQGKGGGAVEVVVVDNASGDGTADVIEGEFPDVQLIRNEKNLYYAAACNQGVKTAGGDSRFILLLNPDVQLGEDTLGQLADYLVNSANVAAVAPRLVYPEGEVQQSVRRFPTYATLWYELTGLSKLFPRHRVFGGWRMNLENVGEAIDVDQPMASCLLVRRKIWESLGGFDERFPMFFNDVDFCYRMKRSGGRIVYLPQARAVHRPGSSVRPVMAKMVWFSHLGFLRFLRKHYRSSLDDFKYTLTAPFVLVGALMRSVFWCLRKKT